MRRLVLSVLLLVIAMGSGWLLGQQQPAPIPQGLRTGADIGIRVTGKGRDNKLYGTLMVRQNGEWVEISVGHPGGVVPLESR